MAIILLVVIAFVAGDGWRDRAWQIKWADRDNGYADAMEPVFEQPLVARYGFNQLELTAIGCTRQSEANRKGRWGILTNNKDRVVTFSVGLDGNIPQPGYIIAVADEMLSGRVTGGRISAVNGRVITLDRVADAADGDRLIFNLPSGAAQSRTIQAVSGKNVTVTTAYTQTPEAESVWVVESDELYAQQYRVVSVADNDDGTFTLPVKTVDSATQLTLVSNFTGPSQSGSAWSAVPRTALNMVTAALVAQSTEALRGLNFDKQNWQSIFTGTGNVTVRLPDGSSWTGPAWNSITSALAGKADSTSLGDAAGKNVGTTAGTVAAGDDSRLKHFLNCRADAFFFVLTRISIYSR